MVFYLYFLFVILLVYNLFMIHLFLSIFSDICHYYLGTPNTYNIFFYKIGRKRKEIVKKLRSKITQNKKI